MHGFLCVPGIFFPRIPLNISRNMEATQVRGSVFHIPAPYCIFVQAVPASTNTSGREQSSYKEPLFSLSVIILQSSGDVSQ